MASGEPFSSDREHKTCCDHICCGKKNPIVSFPPTANGNAVPSLPPHDEFPCTTAIDLARIATQTRSDPLASGIRPTVTAEPLTELATRHFRHRIMPRRKNAREWKLKHRWAPNRLRHTAATELRKRFGLEAAQVVLGHSVADVTQIYAERDMAKAAEVIKQVG